MIYFEYFFIFAIIGWIVEVIYQATTKGLIINRGFLNGPICPIYGFGMVSIKIFLDNYPLNSLEIFLLGLTLATLIELIGGIILHATFGIRLWDYSNMPFNFRGYICAKFSLMWGIGILTAVKVICPVIDRTYIPENTAWAIIHICMLVLIIDWSVSFSIAIGLSNKIQQLKILQEKMRILSDLLSQTIGNNALKTTNAIEETKIQLALAKTEAEKELKEKKEELSQ